MNGWWRRRSGGATTSTSGWVSALALLGLVLFALALRGEGSERAWQLFHVNWLVFTGLTGGSLALAAVHKVVNARWSGMLIRFAEAVVGFAPFSLLGCVLIFTVGYPHIYSHMQEQLPAMSHGKQVWLSHNVMFARLFIGLSVLFWVGWKIVRTDLVPDVFAAKGLATGGRRAMFERYSRDFDGSEGAQERIYLRLRRLGPIYVVLYAIVFTSSPSTASWRCSRTGSRTCSAAGISWDHSLARTCCSP